MTKQEMRKFAQEQISYYQREIEWTQRQISKINDQLKTSKKEDKEMKAFAQTYMDGKLAANFEGNYQSEETRKLVNLRRKYQRWIKQFQAHIAHYEQEVSKYSEEASEETEQTSEEAQEAITYSVLTDLGIISQYKDTHIESLEEAESIAEEYVAQGYEVEIRDEETGETIKLYTKEAEEEQTMKKPTMTKAQAIREIATLTSSTLARICGSTNYSVIDDCSSKLILAASSMEEDAFEGCENWLDVLDRLGKTLGGRIYSWYILGNMDYREYHIKYGYDEAVTILQNYIETITQEGIADSKIEQDYIRGAKDALCIA